jgi:hypothetical protein
MQLFRQLIEEKIQEIGCILLFPWIDYRLSPPSPASAECLCVAEPAIAQQKLHENMLEFPVRLFFHFFCQNEMAKRKGVEELLENRVHIARRMKVSQSDEAWERLIMDPRVIVPVISVCREHGSKKFQGFSGVHVIHHNSTEREDFAGNVGVLRPKGNRQNLTDNSTVLVQKIGRDLQNGANCAGDIDQHFPTALQQRKKLFEELLVPGELLRAEVENFSEVLAPVRLILEVIDHQKGQARVRRQFPEEFEHSRP